MSSANVIALTRIKSSRRDLRLFGYDKIRRKNYQLWDISRATSQITHDWEFDDMAQRSDRIKKICSEEELDNEIEKIKNSDNFFVIDKDRVHRNKEEVRKVEEKVSEVGKLSEKYGKVHPIRNTKRGKKSLVKSYYKYLRRMIGNETKRRGKENSEYIFIPTSWGIGRADRVGVKSKTKKIHVEEYDEYLISKESKKKCKRKGAVYIDQGMPYHAGMKKLYGEEWIEEDKYYREVEKFLRKLEDQKGISKNEISVTAHPQTSKKRIKSFFDGRRVTKGKTPEEVRNSNTVVTHSSTAVLYAAMEKIDVCFFSVESILGTEEHKHAQNMAKIFGRKLNTQNKGQKIDYGKDERKYDKIMKKFVKAEGTPDINSWLYVYNTLTE